MNEVVIATANPGKAQEFKHMLEPQGYQVKTLLDFPDFPDIEETGVTFEENATIKATTAAKMLKLPVIADDSGLSIVALNGEPGVYSARYAGLVKDDALNRQKVLAKLEDIPEDQRQASFHCALVVSDDEGNVMASYHGQMHGEIAKEEVGDNGFGYDPILKIPSLGKTTAQLTADEKDAISHRGQALANLQADIESGKLVL